MKRCNCCWGHYFCPQNYRVLRGFTYKGEIKKKKPTVHRWKTKKKNKYQTGWWTGGSWKKDWKHYTKRKHRRWQRDAIRKEEFDKFHDRSYNNADNPWNWD